MAKEAMDLRKLFVPVRLHNTQANGKEGDSSFDTTDIAYFHSTADILDNPKEKRMKSPSDFALSNFAWQVNDSTAEDGKNTGSFWLRTATNRNECCCIGDDGVLSTTEVGSQFFGSSVALEMSTESLITALKQSQHVNLTTKKTKMEKRNILLNLENILVMLQIPKRNKCLKTLSMEEICVKGSLARADCLQQMVSKQYFPISVQNKIQNLNLMGKNLSVLLFGLLVTTIIMQMTQQLNQKIQLFGIKLNPFHLKFKIGMTCQEA